MDVRWIERILLRDLETMKREVTSFPDETTLWATPPGIANSAGTLALHAAGNIRHFIGAGLGQSGYRRDREREFTARGVARDSIVAELDEAIEAVRQTLGSGAAFDLKAEYPETVAGKFRVRTGDWLIHLATHLAFHVGQVGYLRRMITADPKPVPAVGIAELATAVRQPD
jgi:hypothetical protein